MDKILNEKLDYREEFEVQKDEEEKRTKEKEMKKNETIMYGDGSDIEPERNK